MRNASFERVVEGIREERAYQDKKWGDLDHKVHGITAWMLIMRKELIEAEDEWMKKGNDEALLEILQVVATGVACLEQHGVVLRFEDEL